MLSSPSPLIPFPPSIAGGLDFSFSPSYHRSGCIGGLFIALDVNIFLSWPAAGLQGHVYTLSRFPIIKKLPQIGVFPDLQQLFISFYFFLFPSDLEFSDSCFRETARSDPSLLPQTLHPPAHPHRTASLLSLRCKPCLPAPDPHPTGTAVAPDILLRIGFPHSSKKLYQFFLVFRFKRFSAEKRKSLDIGRLQRFYDLIFRFFRVWLSILEIPCLRIETALAMMTSVRYKQADTHPRTIGDIIFFDCSVIHPSASPLLSLTIILLSKFGFFVRHVRPDC